MRAHNAILIYALMAIMLHVQWSNATDIGSDTAVTRFTTQQILENGDRIATYATLEGGFALDNPFVVGTFDSIFPVSGPTNFNFGTLNLNKDLIFHNKTSIAQLGNINGNEHIIELARTMTVVPAFATVINPCDISIITSIDAVDIINSVDWNATGTSIAIGMANNVGNEVEIYSWNNTTTTLSDITGISVGQTVNSVRWHPMNDWVAVGRNNGAVFIYSYDGASLTELDSLALGGFVINEVAWDPSGEHLALATDSPTQELIVYEVSGAGIFGSSVTENLSASANSVSWESTGTLLAVGLDASAGGSELLVYSFSTGPLTLTFDAGAEIGNQINSVDWNKGDNNTDVIAIGLATGTNRLQLYRHSTGSLTQVTTTASDVVNEVHWRIGGNCLAVGLDTNSSGEVRTYEFNDDGLSLEGNREVNANVNATRWDHSGAYLAAGADNNSLLIYRFDKAFLDTNLTFNNVSLYLNNDLTLQNCSISFEGDCLIEGRNNRLILDSLCSFTVAGNSTLHFSNILIKDIVNEQIACSDDSGTLILERSNVEFGGDFQFKQGALEIEGPVELRSSNPIFSFPTFSYQSTQTLAINPRSSLIIDFDITFSYDTTDPGLIVMKDPSSELRIEGGVLALSNDLILTGGSLTIFRTASIKDESSTGLTIGNGINSGDCTVTILNAQALEITKGVLNYKNVNSGSWLMLGRDARLNLLTGACLNLFQNLNLALGIISFGPNTILGRVPGKTIIGSNHILGSLMTATL